MTKQLSTDELFHFTKFDRLLNIVKEGFHPRYCLEHTYLSDLVERPSSLGCIPMVCFCDIPLNLVRDHTIKYGKSAIGLDKKWGEQYGVSPVLYVHKNSRIADAISTLGNSFSNYHSSMIEKGSDMRIFNMISTIATGVVQLSYFVKQYERTEDESYFVGNKPHHFKKGRFYDEREWRFVPPDNSNEDLWLINVEAFENEMELNKAHEKLKKYSLKFQLHDIRYFITETKEEQEKLADAVAQKFNIEKETVHSKIKFKLLSEI